MTVPQTSAQPTAPAVIVVVGAGPRGAGFLERLGANLPELLPDRRIEVHFVDPHPPGAGRVWRHAQSQLLRMNSMAEDVTMFTDESVTCVGPIRPGPSLFEWAARERDRLPADAVDPELRDLTGGSFATRQLQSRYLAWFFQQAVANLPSTVDVRVHATTVRRITGSPSGSQQVWLADRPTPLRADLVILAMGHLDAEVSGTEAGLADFARRHDLYYLPPAYSADVDLSPVQPGQSLIMRGFGLAFIDLMALLTEGRGGRFDPAPDGSLRYTPSGREPLLYVGSRRGVPYHAKTTYRLTGARPPLPRYFGPDAVDALLAEPGRLDFTERVWPLMAKEIAFGYYYELFTGHPDRVNLSWAEFDARYAPLAWDSPELRALVDESVPDPTDRLDFQRLDRPMAGLRFATSAELQDYLHAYVHADLARRSDQTHSADLGAFLALLSVYGQLPRIVAAGKLTASSRVRRLEGWWTGFFSYFASGPPGDRLEQLLALSRAGIVRFLGADMWVRPDAERGLFVAGSVSTDEEVTATGLVEARLPRASVRDTADELLRGLHRGGEAVEELLFDGPGSSPVSTGLVRASAEDGRVLDPNGRPHQRRFALGPFTTVRTAAAFARPKTNAPAFRYNDATARAVLTEIAGTDLSAAPLASCDSVVRG
jgi:hypothetical protein